jgi:hypothetical protein
MTESVGDDRRSCVVLIGMQQTVHIAGTVGACVGLLRICVVLTNGVNISHVQATCDAVFSICNCDCQVFSVQQMHAAQPRVLQTGAWHDVWDMHVACVQGVM